MKSVYLPDDNDLELLEKNTNRAFFVILYFLFKRTFTKITTYISFIVLLAAPISSFLLPFFITGINTNDTNFFIFIKQFFMIGSGTTIFAAAFWGVNISLELFNEPQKNGLEILIVSKPVSRAQIIFARLLFLMITCLICSLIVFSSYLISIAVIGSNISNNKIYNQFSNIYWSPQILVGAFLAPFLGYWMFSLLTILLGLKFSSKTSKTIATGITGLSFSLSIIVFQVQPLLYQNFNQKFNQDAARKIDLFLENKKDTNKEKVFDMNLDNKNKANIIVSGYSKTGIGFDGQSKKLVLDAQNFVFSNKNNGALYKPTETYNSYGKRKYFSIPNKDSNQEDILRMQKYRNWNPKNDKFAETNSDSFAPTKTEYDTWYNEKLEIYKKNMSILFNIFHKAFKDYQVNPNPIVTLSYLNPFTTLMSIMNVTDSVLDKYSNSQFFLSNYWYSINIKDSKSELSEINMEIDKKIKEKADPNWALVIIILGINSIILSAIWLIYQRKDFV